jgi:Asp-tRNA(Asn)/Glu-tRNA(Gln) amidotransferase A subunit family amidase
MTRPVSLSGLPALAIPAGLSGDGLPLGIQLVAGRRRERLLLETAAMLGEADSRFLPMRAPYPPPGLDQGPAVAAPQPRPPDPAR